MSHQTNHIYEFDPFRLNAAEHLLLREGEAVPLQPKAFNLLLALVERHGHLLEKEELLKLVWPDAIVEEANLASNISLLRKALGDGENGHRYIETVPKRGYRFVANVRYRSEEIAKAIQAEKLVVQDLPQERRSTTSRSKGDVGERAASPESRGSKIRQRQRVLIVAAVSLVMAGAVSFIVVPTIRRKYETSQPALRPFSQLTYGAGLQGEPTWSPDGRMIAYTSDRSGNFDIWVQQVNGGDPINVTKSPEHDWQPNWSPDGSSIVFRSERDGGGLFVAPALGGIERKLTSFGYYPRWSPDGSQILFFDFPFQLTRKAYVVALNGEAPREVQSSFLRGFVYRGVRGVAWHPDGKRISVWGDHAKLGLGFWTMPITGGAAVKSEIPAEVEKQLKEAAVSLEEFQWAPSGEYLYFEGISKLVRNLWRVTVDPQTLRWVEGSERLTTDAGLDTDLALSPNGKKLAYTISNESSRIWAIPFQATTGQVKGTGQPVTAAGMNVMYSDLSRDGKKLSFSGLRAGKFERWEKSLEDNREQLLAPQDDFMHVHGFWSRDGTRLVSYRMRPQKAANGSLMTEYSIVIYPAGGGEEQVITSPTTHEYGCYDWSADGRWVLGYDNPRTPGRSLIQLLSVDNAPHAETRARVVTSSEEYYLWQTRFSPDQRWVSFNAEDKVDKTRPSTIYVVPASGGEWRPITEGKYWDDVPRWSPDGKIIYFISRRTGFYNVWGIRFNSAIGRPVGEPFRVTPFEGPVQITPQLGAEISVSASRLIVPIREVTGNIWLLENVDR